MYKHRFIIDADSLIKLTKISIINKICQSFHCSITKEVYAEVVTQGKERLHQDAFKIEKLVKNRSIKLNKTKPKKMEIRKTLDEGEKSIYLLYKSSKNTMLVSDDNTFLNFLKEEGEKFTTPTRLITLLKSLNIINSKQALVYLNKMKPYIKPETYLRVKDTLGGEK